MKKVKMKQHRHIMSILSGAAILLGSLTAVTGCSSEPETADQANTTYLTIDQQRQLLSQSSDKVLDLMDNSGTTAFGNYLKSQSEFQLNIPSLTTSIVLKPLLLAKYSAIAKSISNKTFKGSSVNFSVDVNLKSSIVTDWKSGQSRHTANLSLGGKKTSVIFSISDNMVSFGDARVPQQVDWKLEHEGTFLYGLKYKINKFDLVPENSGTMIDIEASGTMEEVENLISLKLDRKTGLHASFVTVCGDNTLLGFYFDINTDLTDVEQFDRNSLIAWAIDSQKHKTIQLSTTLMDGEVTSCAKTVDPFDNEEKILIGEVLTDIFEDTILNAERLGVIFDHMRPYTTQDIWFNGYQRSQASVCMVTQEQLESLDYDKLVADIKRVDAFIGRLDGAGLTDILDVLDSDTTLVASVLEDIDMIDRMLYDLPVVIHEENIEAQDTVTIRQYWQDSGIEDVKDRYKSMTYSVFEPFFKRKTPLVKDQEELVGLIEWISEKLLK